MVRKESRLVGLCVFNVGFPQSLFRSPYWHDNLQKHPECGCVERWWAGPLSRGDASLTACSDHGVGVGGSAFKSLCNVTPDYPDAGSKVNVSRNLVCCLDIMPFILSTSTRQTGGELFGIEGKVDGKELHCLGEMLWPWQAGSDRVHVTFQKSHFQEQGM